MWCFRLAWAPSGLLISPTSCNRRRFFRFTTPEWKEWRNMPPDMVKPNDAPATSPGYETRDASVRTVLNFLLFLTLFLVATGLISWGMFRYFSAQEKKDDRASSPFAGTRQLPLGTELQVTPRED